MMTKNHKSRMRMRKTKRKRIETMKKMMMRDPHLQMKKKTTSSSSSLESLSFLIESFFP
jgi:hypothetical protein